METPTELQSAAAQDARPIWVAPQMTLLPVEATAHNGNTGNDGIGPTTHS